jgi:hypothetical protein
MTVRDEMGRMWKNKAFGAYLKVLSKYANSSNINRTLFLKGRDSRVKKKKSLHL